ncbi:helix-turn-helix domain-containing protein [Kitasatospora sp. NPDC127116]|uniref:helix-turn-helix domain-containing protein n=1 Tax=Kitasatospora sp. NPDC127116 TaxID=3345367 RepID=UPI00363293F8
MPQHRYFFNSNRLIEIAADAGDHTGYAIAQRTGLSEGTLSRIINGRRQPKLDSAAHLARTYGVALDDLVSVAA